ncbi:hypothetical protein AAY24_04405 [Sedimenticola thiotaurini]|uniref:Uncharacterized protein n=1 Tax=Sedimenticola thiotaurini TaxID=1543721 RepID=A0A0F7JWG7_9GAMM|nr:hypothetical protein AAY24_04405 [Sedimenticola thiotaurini]
MPDYCWFQLTNSPSLLDEPLHYHFTPEFRDFQTIYPQAICCLVVETIWRDSRLGRRNRYIIAANYSQSNYHAIVIMLFKINGLINTCLRLGFIL